jgi:hypothetical protein
MTDPAVPPMMTSTSLHATEGIPRTEAVTFTPAFPEPTEPAMKVVVAMPVSSV